MSDDGREGGYLLLHRRVMSSAVWDLPLAQYRVWETVLLMANWKPSTVMVRGQALTIPRGSCLIAERTLAEYGRVTRKVVQKALATLERIGMVSFTKIGPGAKGGPTVRIINILNYEKYQTHQEEDRGQPGGQPGVRSEEGKKGKKKEPPSRKRSDPDLEALQAGMVEAFRVVTGEPYLWTGPDWGVLGQLRKAGVEDAGILRRWDRFLRWEVYPKKNLHTFRDAFQGAYLREQSPLSSKANPVIPLFK